MFSTFWPLYILLSYATGLGMRPHGEPRSVSAVARASLAMFRADCARYAGDPDFERLVARLTRLSPEFAQWWPQREVARPLAGEKRIDHPTAGRMLFEYSSFGVGDPPDMKLIVFTPLDDEGTVQKLDRLLRAAPF